MQSDFQFKMNGSKRTKEDESSSSDEEVMEMENEEINIEFEGVLHHYFAFAVHTNFPSKSVPAICSHK